MTPAEIDEARADLETMLPDTSTIQRKTVVGDGGGGEIVTWPPIATGLPCRLTPAPVPPSGRGGGVVETASRLQDDTTHILTFAALLDVQVDDRAVVGGETYEVLVVGNGGGWEIARHVRLRKAPA